MIGGACQGATPTTLAQPIGAALRPPWPSASIEGLTPYAGLYSLLAVSSAAPTLTTSSSPTVPPLSPSPAPSATPIPGVVPTAVLAHLHALCVQQKDGALAGALAPLFPGTPGAPPPSTSVSSGPTTVPSTRYGPSTGKPNMPITETHKYSLTPHISLGDNSRVSSNVVANTQSTLKYMKKDGVAPASKVNGLAMCATDPESAVKVNHSAVCAKDGGLVKGSNTKEGVSRSTKNKKLISTSSKNKQRTSNINLYPTKCGGEGVSDGRRTDNYSMAPSVPDANTQNHISVPAEEDGVGGPTRIDVPAIHPQTLVPSPVLHMQDKQPSPDPSLHPSRCEENGLKLSGQERLNPQNCCKTNNVINHHLDQSSADRQDLNPSNVSTHSLPPASTTTNDLAYHNLQAQHTTVQTTPSNTKPSKEWQISPQNGEVNADHERQCTVGNQEATIESFSKKSEVAKDNGEVRTNSLVPLVGGQCSRTTPGLLQAYARGRRTRPQTSPTSTSSSMPSPAPALSPENTPISVDDASTSSACPPIVALTQLTVPRVAPPASAAAADAVRSSRKPSRSEERPAPAVSAAASGIPVGIAVARQRQDPRPPDETQPGVLPRMGDPGNSALPTHWSLPPTPCTPGLPPPPFWLPQSQFSGVGVDAGVGAGMGLGYQFARDPLTGHYYLLPHPHAIPDPGSHGLLWAGYGGVAAPPVMMTPQQLLLPDAHYHRALHAHPALIHVPHAHTPVHAPTSPSIKREDPPTPGPPEEDPKSRPVSVPPPGQGPPQPGSELSLPPPIPAGLRHIPPSYLYPPQTSLPYYCPQSTHPAPYSLPPYPHPPTTTLDSSFTTTRTTSLTTTHANTFTTPVNMTTFSVLPAAPVSSIAKASSLDPYAPQGCEALVATGSPVSGADSNELINVTSHSEDEPDMEVPPTRLIPPQEPIRVPIPFKIKQEIKEEVPSPVNRDGICTPEADDGVCENSAQAVKKEACIGCDVNQTCTKTLTTIYVSQVENEYQKSHPTPHSENMSTEIQNKDMAAYNSSPVHVTEQPETVSQEPKTLNHVTITETLPKYHATKFYDPKVGSTLSSEPHDGEAENHIQPHRMETEPHMVMPPAAPIIWNPETGVAPSYPLVRYANPAMAAYNPETQAYVHPDRSVACQDHGLPNYITPYTGCQEAQTNPQLEPTTFTNTNSPYIDVSGLELLSQSILQHANKISETPQEDQHIPQEQTPEEEEPTALEKSAEESTASDKENQEKSEESFEVQQEPAYVCSSEQDYVCSSEQDSCVTDEGNVDVSDEPESESQMNNEEDCPQDEVPPLRDINKITLASRIHELAKACKMDISLLHSSASSPSQSPENSVYLSQSDPLTGLHGLSLLCALAEQRILEEKNVACPALSSLADVAATSPSVPTHPPQRSPSPRTPSQSLSVCTPSPHSPLPYSPLPRTPSPRTPSPHSPSPRTPSPHSPSPRTLSPHSPSPRTLSPHSPSPRSSLLRSSSPQPGTSTETRCLRSTTIAKGMDKPVFGSSTFGLLPNSYITPVKSTDVNRNYKSPQSEREAKAFIANKASQYQRDSAVGFKVPFGFPVDSMDPAELDMRMQLAVIQRKYREKQRELWELSRIQPKKVTASPTKRGPGRPPKRKVHNNDVPGKKKVGRPPNKKKSPQKELSPPILERVTDLQLKTPTKDSDEEKEEPHSTCRSILKPPVLTATFSSHNGSQYTTPTLLEMQPSTEKEESSDEDTDKDKNRRWSISSEETVPPPLDSPFKLPTIAAETRQDESEEEQNKYSISDSSVPEVLKILHTETSVESSPSDLEQQPMCLSSSKKRKPGRPKKHSPTKEDATETIVAKKPKSLNLLLHRPLPPHKPKMRPKLKAEVKVREGDQEEDSEGSSRAHYISTSCTEMPVNDASDEEDHQTSCLVKSEHRGARKRGVPRGRTSFTRRAMLRDKEKRKSAAEKQSAMEALYRSLKKHSTIAVAEHDESEDEKDRDDEPLEGEEQNLIDEPSISDDEISHSTSIIGEAVTTTSIVSSTATTTATTLTTTMTNCTIPTTTTTEVPRPTVESSEPNVCLIEVGDLVDKARVLVLQDGLLYAGYVVSITPPDVYGVVIDGERGSRPHIYCREELLDQSWKEVKPGTTRFLKEGTRVCAFWSQQYRALYPGMVAPSSSPAHEANHNFVNVEFDDGDSGKIHVDDIRLLPPEFPVLDYDPNPLMTLQKRKRRPTGDSLPDIKEELPKTRPKKFKTTHNDEDIDDLQNEVDLNNEVEKENKKTSMNINKDEKENEDEKSFKKTARKADKKKHKKHKHTDPSHHHRHKHKNKHKHKHREGDRPLPHIEPGINELTMRIKSPPPPLGETRKHSYQEESESEIESSLSKTASEEDSEEDDSEYTPTKKTKSPARRKKRHPSGKSKIAPFLPERQLWRWSGKGFKRPGAKGKGKKEFFKAIIRGKEMIRVGDSAVFLSAGQPDRPYIGRIELMWEAWGGNMVVKVKWFYHPQETKGLGKRLTEPKGALFQSPHTDENDVQTISHKCDVIALSEYRIQRQEQDERYGPNCENYDIYYLAGSYDPTTGHITMEPGVS